MTAPEGAGARRLLGPVLTLAGGTAAAQALVFAARPALTRLYSPEAWGILTLFVTVVTFASAVSSGGYRFALLLPAGEPAAAALLRLSLRVALGVGALAAVGVGAGVALGALPAVWWWLPATIVALEIGLSSEQWLTRRDLFAPASASRVVQQVVAVGVHVGAGLAGLAAAGAAWLVGGTAAGYVAGALVAGGWLWWRARPPAAEPIAPLAHRYRRFPLFSAPAALLNLVSTRLPVFVIAAVGTTAEVGQFGIAFGALALPLGLVTGSVAQVFIARAAEAVRTGHLPALTRRVLHGLLAVTAFPCLAVVAAGPTLFATVFGDAWVTAGEYARVMAPWVLAASIAAPLTSIFDVLERQRADLGFSIVMAVGTAAALTAGALNGSALAVVAAGSAAGTVLRVGHVAWLLHLARVPAAGVLADAARVLAGALVLAAGVWAVDQAVGGVAVLAAVAVGALATTGAAWRAGQR